MKDLNLLCSQVRIIAHHAGEYLKKERKQFSATKVEEKSAHNYVSYVDKAAEQMIVEQLKTLMPEAGVIAEEGSGSHSSEEYCWVIDPLDGTTNYIHDMAPYCVSIALRKNGETLLGVVYEVHRDECFHAIKGGKAYLNDKVIQVSEISTLEKSFVALGFPYSFKSYHPLAVYLVDKLYGSSAGCRLLGSAAAELCYVAAGRFEARVEAFLGPWDIAAGAFILQQAGGVVTDFQGGNNWSDGEEVLASNGKIHTEMQALLASFNENRT
ncbi:inositol monophosphatase family protein [Parabacteroides bouchesdurhonensis]|uniref:inositol monophosphatase family protein n=1 Tax=Parabacteroides bouchesdurhonensis TaxID=1936995 RepID=UPI000C838F4B|nr:inositol monophosphatase family protein [Parabacteroides bouchesdurhonensis]